MIKQMMKLLLTQQSVTIQKVPKVYVHVVSNSKAIEIGAKNTPSQDNKLRYISKYLVQFVLDAKPQTKGTTVRISGARVLTSEKCATIIQEHEEKKQKEQEEKERKKKKKQEKEEEQRKKKALVAEKRAQTAEKRAQAAEKRGFKQKRRLKLQQRKQRRKQTKLANRQINPVEKDKLMVM